MHGYMHTWSKTAIIAIHGLLVAGGYIISIIITGHVTISINCSSKQRNCHAAIQNWLASEYLVMPWNRVANYYESHEHYL